MPGASSLPERIAGDHYQEALRQLLDDWYRAIVSSRDGRRQAEPLGGKLLEVL